MPYLLRVELPDVPGSLGRVASAIGEAGGDIEAIEIVEHRRDGTAVDDVLLETAPGVMPDSLVSACNQLDGVRVLWVSRYGAGGNLFLDLEAVEALTQNPGIALRRDRRPAADHVPRRLGDAAAPGRRPGQGAAPHLGGARRHRRPTDWFPAKQARRLDLPDDWHALADGTLVAGAPMGDEDELMLFGRRGGPEVLDSELARLGHLAALADSIAKAG